MRRNGLPHYNRGHLGHGVGLSLAIEESPLISPNETHLLEPGMVLSLQMPYYGYGVGAISIEDMILITDDGHEVLSTLSRELVDLSELPPSCHLLVSRSPRALRNGPIPGVPPRKRLKRIPASSDPPFSKIFFLKDNAVA